MIPVALRDALFKLFAASLRSARPAEAFAQKAARLERATAAERRFFDDRLPRYEGALSEVAALPRADRFARELETAQALFNHGLFFDAHEFLETAWKREPEPRKTYVQGLIQIAAAFHKLELTPDATEGAHYLLARGLAKASVPEIAEALWPVLKELSLGRAPRRAPPVKFPPA